MNVSGSQSADITNHELSKEEQQQAHLKLRNKILYTFIAVAIITTISLPLIPILDPNWQEGPLRYVMSVIMITFYLSWLLLPFASPKKKARIIGFIGIAILAAYMIIPQIKFLLGE